MILLQSTSRFLLQVLLNRVQKSLRVHLFRLSITNKFPLEHSFWWNESSQSISWNDGDVSEEQKFSIRLFWTGGVGVRGVTHIYDIDKGVELDCHSLEFDDVRYHIQVSMRYPEFIVLSMSLPTPPPETIFVDGLPFGALDAIKEAYGVLAQILDPPKDGYNLTMKLNLTKLPQDEEEEYDLLEKIASLREVVLGAPLRFVLEHLPYKKVAPGINQLVALVHRQKESFFLVPEVDKVTVVFPMRFKDSTDIVLATSFLQEFVEARRTAGLNNAPPCFWSPSPPLELSEAPSHAQTANAGFVTFVIFPRHVESRKLDKTVWSLLTFHAYVSYHVKCSEGFMHTRMRRRVESLIQALDRAKPDTENSKNSQSRSFKRLSLKEARNSSNF